MDIILIPQILDEMHECIGSYGRDVVKILAIRGVSTLSKNSPEI